MHNLLSEGLTSALLWAAVVTFIAMLVLLRRVLGFRILVPIAALKTLIPFMYFAWFNDGQWLLEDDVMYFERGHKILEIEPNVFLALFDSEMREAMQSQAGGSHILYGWWNALAIRIFGDFYHAPIFLNVILTAIAGLYLYGILRESGFGTKYSKGCLIFFLVHWDILAWSSFVNLKDNGVLLLTVMAFYYAFRLLHRFSFRILTLFFFTLSAFAWIRFYVPVFIVLSYVIWVSLRWRSSKKYLLLPVLGVIFYFIFPWGSVADDRIFLNEFLYGAVRFFLTPQPWSVDADYSFITLSALLHWLFIPFSAAGAFLLWKKSPFSQILLIYLAILICFYAVVPELAGPRHRVQFAFIVVVLQYTAAWSLLSALHLIRSPTLDPHPRWLPAT